MRTGASCCSVLRAVGRAASVDAQPPPAPRPTLCCSTSWAGLFTFRGGKLTTGPNGNGVAEQISDTQWTFVPNDPAQVGTRGLREGAIQRAASLLPHACCSLPLPAAFLLPHYPACQMQTGA